MACATYLGMEDFDILASDLDTSLSGLGGTTSTTYDMSEALSVLQVLNTSDDARSTSKHSAFSGSLNELDNSPVTENNNIWADSDSPRKIHPKTVKKPCRKSIGSSLKNNNSPEVSDGNSPEHPVTTDEASLLRVASAPLLSRTFYKSSFPPDTLMKRTTDKAEFQYTLAAPTALGSKIGEETLTYLNQGQSYEIRLKKLTGLAEMRGKLLKSDIRVGFQERRLQFREKAEICAWKNQRPWDRILDIDLALSYGIFDVRPDPNDINHCEFMWDPTREASVFLRINCISTEFTCKRKGGEKGVPFRILIETYGHWEDPPKKMHTASCLVKVFKAKGADRKRKTDREKIEKLPQSEQRDLQPSYQLTVFTEYSGDIEEHDRSSPSYISSHITSFGTNNARSDSYVTSPTPEIITPTVPSPKLEIPQENKVLQMKCKEEIEENVVSDVLSSKSSSSDVYSWLVKNRFSRFLSHFASFSGNDLLCLTREDLMEICGVADGIRLHNSLQMRHICPRLTFYTSYSEQTFRAMYIESLTAKDVAHNICSEYHLHKANLKDIFLIGPSGILIYLSDKVVQNIKNDSIYILEIIKEHEDETFSIILQPYCSQQNVTLQSFSTSPADGDTSAI